MWCRVGIVFAGMSSPTDLDGVQWDFVAPQGFDSDFKVICLDPAGLPEDLTGADIELAVRAGFKDPVVLLLTLVSSPSNVSTPTPANGEIFVHFDEADTLLFAAPKKYVYDLRVDGVRKVWGSMTTRPGVTINV